ncbi:MAG: lamin tail domain-containing protein [Chitinispirillaceae bacterium]|nr:lamin tail domain-containing protein [Chitinispirillaceae bacterium]
MKKVRLPGKLAWKLLLCGTIGLLTGCVDKPTETEETFDKNLYNLRLTEINYNPADLQGIPGDSLEFLELKNVGDTDLDLGSLEITDGVTYQFPADATLAAGKFYVIAISASKFEEAYGFDPDGVYTGVLSNSGEFVTIKDVEFNEVVVNQMYADTGAWPEAADGEGYSLVSTETDPPKDSIGAAYWKRSGSPGGSPGADDVALAVDSTVFDLRITEIHYNPLTADPLDSDSLEFIEIKNTGSRTVSLGTVMLRGGVEYLFSDDDEIGAGEFLVLVSNLSKFEERFPSVAPVGEYTGKLSNSGEMITLFDIAADTAIVEVEYNNGGAWPDAADGMGYSLVPVSKNPERDQNSAILWRQSTAFDGSPGADDQGIAIITEVLTHTDEPQTDAIELFNPGDDEVDVGGWYLSDDSNNPIKFKIPDGTRIPAGEYITFDESDFNANPDSASCFTFNSHGEEAWLVADERGCGFGYCHGVEFGELENGVSVGRHVNSQGKEVFVAQKNITLGEANDGPLVGPLVISEIMYHSVDNAGDYLEITNISSAEVALSHPEVPDHTWKIAGVAFTFPAGATIKAGESVVIASDSLDEVSFRNRYGLNEDVQVFAMTGGLKNSEERIELLKPEDPYVVDSTVSVDSLAYPHMLFDAVKYSDDSPWPSSADGAGLSLHRISLTEFGDEPENWVAGVPSPGAVEGD